MVTRDMDYSLSLKYRKTLLGERWVDGVAGVGVCKSYVGKLNLQLSEKLW